MCEELGHEYGVVPFIIMKLPWVHFKEIWKSYSKRMMRRLHQESAMRGVDIFGGMVGGSPPANEVTDEQVDKWISTGLPVTIVRK